MKKNLIMGVSKGYGRREIEPFVTSWRENASDSELVLFVGDMSDWTKSCILSTNEETPKVSLLDIPEEFDERLIIDARWTLYANFLEEHRGEYDQVLLTDVRDVIFQGNLFDSYSRNEKYLGYAIEGNVIGQSDLNRKWLVEFLGEEAFDSVKDKMIICCGTTWGTVDEVLKFCRKMEEMLVKSTFWGAEQAAANYIIYNNLVELDNIIESNLEQGGVLTLAWDNTGTRDAYIINKSDEIPAVVHMYTSHADLIKFVKEHYHSDELPTVDKFEDVLSRLDFADANFNNGREREAFNVLMQLIDAHPEYADWNGAFNRLVKIFNAAALEKTVRFETELVEHACGQALVVACEGGEVSTDQLDAMYALVKLLQHNRHTICKTFENFVGTLLWTSVRIYSENDYIADAAEAIERMASMNFEFDEEYYFRAAELNRRLGRKDKSREYYNKLLDMR